MSQNEADTIYGKVAFQNDNFVVRVKMQDNKLRVIAHQIINGQEFSPKGYVLGKNALIMKGK